MTRRLNLTQEWVTRVTQEPDGFPGANGAPGGWAAWSCDGCGAIFRQPDPETGKEHYCCPECGHDVIGEADDDDVQDEPCPLPSQVTEEKTNG